MNLRIYEIDFIRKYDAGALSTCWQIPAENEWTACARIGQLVESDDCEISITEVRLVSGW